MGFLTTFEMTHFVCFIIMSFRGAPRREISKIETSFNSKQNTPSFRSSRYFSPTRIEQYSLFILPVARRGEQDAIGLSANNRYPVALLLTALVNLFLPLIMGFLAYARNDINNTTNTRSVLTCTAHRTRHLLIARLARSILPLSRRFFADARNDIHF